MLRNCTRLECVVENKMAHFYCDMDTPLHVVKEMVFQFQKFVGQVEDQVRANLEVDKEKESESSPAIDEEPKPE